MARLEIEQPPPEIADDPAAYLAWKRAHRGRRRGEAMPGLVRLSDVRNERVKWLWPGRIPRGKLTVVDGDPGVGKSLLACDMAARTSTGKQWPDKTRGLRGGGGVLMLAAEDGTRDTIRPRVEAAGGDLSRVLVLQHVPGSDGGLRAPVLPLDLGVIEAIVTAERVRLAVVDVLTEYIAPDVRMNADPEMRRALAALAAVAEATDTALVAIRHLNKRNDVNNPLYRGGGSIAITGRARAVHLCALDPDDPSGARRVFAPLKVTNAPHTPPLAYEITGPVHAPYLNWLGADPHSADELLGATLGADERAERDEIVWWLTEFLQHCENGEAPYADIARAAAGRGIPLRTLRRARERAKVSFHRAGWEAGTVWRLDEWKPSGPIEAIEAKHPDPGPDGPDVAPMQKPGKDG
jgi:hypothetical protein